MNALGKLRIRNRLIAAAPFLAAVADYWMVAKSFRSWRAGGVTLPLPSQIKRCIIKAAARRLGADAFVETGTYMGDTPWFFRRDFARIHSIEVQPDLAAIAAQRFAGHGHVTIHAGDSANVLGTICPTLDRPVVFWLDGHYSGGITGRGATDCPLWEELEGILSGTKVPFAILIDDARCFGIDPHYPKADELRDYLLKQRPDYQFSIENDLVVFAPSAPSP